MIPKFEMPGREANDGPVTIERGGRGFLLSVVNAGKKETIDCSAFNAWRLIGMLSLMLGLPLVKAAQKAIKL